MSISIDRILTTGLEVATGVEITPPTNSVKIPNMGDKLMKDVNFINDTDTSLDNITVPDSKIKSLKNELFKVKNNISTLSNVTNTTIDCVNENKIKNKILSEIDNKDVNDRTLFNAGDLSSFFTNKNNDCGSKSIMDTIKIQNDILSSLSDEMLMNVNNILDGQLNKLSINDCLILDKAKTLNSALNKYATALSSINGDLDLKNDAVNANNSNCNGSSGNCIPTINLDLDMNMLPIPDVVTDTINNATNTIYNKLNEVNNYVNKIENMANDTINNVANKVIDTIGPTGLEIASKAFDVYNTINNVIDTSKSVGKIKNLVLESVSETVFCLGGNDVNNFVSKVLSTGITTPSNLLMVIGNTVSNNIDKNIYAKFKTIGGIIDIVKDPIEKAACRANIKGLLPNIIEGIGNAKTITSEPAKMYVDLINGMNTIDPNWNVDEYGNPDYGIAHNNAVFNSVVDSVFNSKKRTNIDKNELLTIKAISSSENKGKNDTNNHNNTDNITDELSKIYGYKSVFNNTPKLVVPNNNINKHVILPDNKPTKSDRVNIIASTLGDLMR